MTLTRRTSLVTFATLTLLLLASEAWIATLVEASTQPGIMAIAIATDLAVGVPLLYYLLLVRKRFLPPLSIVPVVVLTLLAIRFILPSSQQSYLRFGEFLILAIELSIAAFILFKLRHIIREYRSARRDCLYFIDALRTGLQKSFGSELLAAILATEISMLYLVFAGWFTKFRTSRQNVSAYSYHQESYFSFIFWPLVALVIVEAGLLHLIVGIWTQIGAWILTAINVYALLWMVGHFHAVRLQPLIVDDEYIHIRTGLIWRGRIPLAKIADLRKPTLVDSKVPGYVSAALMGEPDMVVVLKEAEELESLFARKKETSIIGISLDDPKAFWEDVGNRLLNRPAAGD